MEKMFIDLECIVTNAGKVTEGFIEKAEHKASKSYLMSADELYRDEVIDHEEYRILTNEHYDYKDRVLEEVDEKYKGAIDYYQIYTLSNANPNMVRYVNKMSKDLETYIIFYYNTEEELNAKKTFIEKYFPTCKIISIKYHKLPYKKNTRRKKTNKAQYVKEQLGLPNLENCILIDKSTFSSSDWNREMGETIIYRKNETILFNSDNENVLKLKNNQ